MLPAPSMPALGARCFSGMFCFPTEAGSLLFFATRSDKRISAAVPAHWCAVQKEGMTETVASVCQIIRALPCGMPGVFREGICCCLQDAGETLASSCSASRHISLRAHHPSRNQPYIRGRVLLLLKSESAMRKEQYGLTIPS